MCMHVFDWLWLSKTWKYRGFLALFDKIVRKAISQRRKKKVLSTHAENIPRSRETFINITPVS